MILSPISSLIGSELAGTVMVVVAASVAAVHGQASDDVSACRLDYQPLAAKLLMPHRRKNWSIRSSSVVAAVAAVVAADAVEGCYKVVVVEVVAVARDACGCVVVAAA